jgi:hypothetical protein
VLVEGEWTKVPQDVIQNVAAPDGGAHVWLQTIRSGHVRTGMKTGQPDHGPDSIEPYRSAAGYRHPQG